MQRVIGIGLGLISAISVAGPASAADQPVPRRERPQQTERAPAQQQSSWSGTQVGGFNGASSVSNSFAEPGSNLFFPCIAATTVCTSPVTSSPDVETPFNFDKDRLSYTFGGFLGYRWQFNSIVAGIEGDFALKRGASSSSLTTSAFARFPSLLESVSRVEAFSGSSKQTWDSSIRARVGLLVTPSVLVYGTGGVAFGKVSGSFSYSATSTFVFDGATFASSIPDLVHTATALGSWSETRVGWTGGGGVEVAIYGPWKARIEYRFTDLGEFTKSVPLTRSCSDPGSGPATCVNTVNSGSSAAIINIASTFQTFRVGLGFDF